LIEGVNMNGNDMRQGLQVSPHANCIVRERMTRAGLNVRAQGDVSLIDGVKFGSPADKRRIEQVYRILLTEDSSGRRAKEGFLLPVSAWLVMGLQRSRQKGQGIAA
jgi:Domain of unknown function (DUF3394)